MEPNNRKPRDMESREFDQRVEPWKPVDSIPTVHPRDGYTFRWVRVTMLGEPDVSNIDRQTREGWVPATGSDVPELSHLIAKDGRGTDVIVNGGLMLCKQDSRRVLQRSQYYADRAVAMQRKVDDERQRSAAEDRRMPMFNESNQTISSTL